MGDTWTGRGQGRSATQPTIATDGGVGAGGGRSSSQPTVSSSSWMSTRQSLLDSAGSLSSSPSDLNDPEGNYVFALEVDGVEIAQFMECSGIKTATEVFEIQEGGLNDRVHKLPGQSKWENITFRYGVTSDSSLLGWRNEIIQDQFEASNRRNGAIIIKNNKMEVVRRYNFKEAWPVAWEGPSLSAGGSELAVEMLEIAHHGVEVT